MLLRIKGTLKTKIDCVVVCATAALILMRVFMGSLVQDLVDNQLTKKCLEVYEYNSENLLIFIGLDDSKKKRYIFNRC